MNDIPTILSTLRFLRRLAGSTLLVKLGGSMLECLEEKKWIFEDLAALRTAGISMVLVHGGGPMINRELKARGIQWEFLDGQRVTTSEIMEVIEMVLFGSVNRKIVTGLNRAGIPAVGLSGIESATLVCKSAGPKLGRVGEIEHVDTSLIQSILNTKTHDGARAIPVIAPIGIGDQGDSLNVNADWVASRVAQFLGLKKLLFLTDQRGILDPNGKVIPELDASELEELIERGAVKEGMLTKTRTILNALRHGAEAVHIISGNEPHALLEELFTDKGIGTVCRLRSRGLEQL